MSKLSRRGLFQSALATAVLSAPTAIPQTAPSDDVLKSAREANSENAKALAAVSVPHSIEPAFVFKP